jgi:hypothetical protein
MAKDRSWWFTTAGEIRFTGRAGLLKALYEVTGVGGSRTAFWAGA